MNSFDAHVLSFVNGFAKRSWALDYAVTFIGTNCVAKGALLTSMYWWAWFRKKEDGEDKREYIVATIVACFVAMFTARALALCLPFRVRPMHDPHVSFRLPFTMEPTVLERWSAFPSDHAALYLTLAIGLLFISRAMGVVGLCYGVLVVCLPRVYLGLHYPTDVLGGAVIAVCAVYGMNVPLIRKPLARRVLRWSERYPSLFYTCFFLITWQIVDVFQNARQWAHFAFNLLKAIIGAS